MPEEETLTTSTAAAASLITEDADGLHSITTNFCTLVAETVGERLEVVGPQQCKGKDGSRWHDIGGSAEWQGSELQLEYRARAIDSAESESRSCSLFLEPA